MTSRNTQSQLETHATFISSFFYASLIVWAGYSLSTYLPQNSKPSQIQEQTNSYTPERISPDTEYYQTTRPATMPSA
jgi:hypothetical protein